MLMPQIYDLYFKFQQKLYIFLSNLITTFLFLVIFPYEVRL